MPSSPVPAPEHVIVANGSPHCDNRGLFRKIAEELHGQYPLAILYTTDSPGAGYLIADEWARACGHISVPAAQAAGTVTVFHADWTAPCRASCTHGRRIQYNGSSVCPSAAVYRDQRMQEAALTAAAPVTTITVIAEDDPRPASYAAAMRASGLPAPIEYTDTARCPGRPR